MELTTILLIFLGIAASAMGRPHTSENALDSPNNKAAIAAYLSDSVKDVQYYRREVIRQIELLLRMSDVIRQHPASSERQLVLVGLVERLAWTYDQLDKSLDLFIPDESELSRDMSLNDSDANDDDDDNSNSVDVQENSLTKRSWPKRMYGNKYSNIPIIRTGK